MFKSFLHWKVWVNILITLGIFFCLVWGIFRWLDTHTNHGKEVPVPNVVNMSVQEAVKELENMGLDVEVDSFKYDPKYKPFQVLQIYPAAGSRVKEGRTVILRINPKTWAKVEVPNLLEKYKGLAFSRLELVGLKVGDTIYEPSIQKDAVLKMIYKGQELKPGTLLPKFSVIDLIIGSGPLRDIAVPNVVGLTVKEAREVIMANNFEFGIAEYESGVKDENDIVYYQDPAVGSLRDQGMQIDVWASKKTPAEMVDKARELDKIYGLPKDEPSEPARETRQANTPMEYPSSTKQNIKVESSPAKPAETKKPEEKKDTKKTEEKPKENTTKPAEKPKPKKVVVE